MRRRDDRASVLLDERVVYGHVLGRLIRRIRIQESTSQASLAERAALSPSALSRFECGQSQPDAYELRQIEAALHLAPARLATLADQALAWTLRAARRVGGIPTSAVGGLAEAAAAAIYPAAATCPTGDEDARA